MLRTGWTEAELAATSPVTVASLRHALYAEAYAKTVGIDVDDELRDLAEAEVTDERAKERIRKKRIAEARERLHGFRKVQAAIRDLLHLDDPEPIPDDEL